MSVVDIIVRKRGSSWVAQVCGATELDTAPQVARLVYEDFRDSPEGQRAWSRVCSSERKADRILDDIYNRDVVDGEMMTDEEWDEISGNLYEMIYEGVF